MNKIKVKKLDAPSRAQRVLANEDIIFQMVRPYQNNNYYFNLDDEIYVASTGYAQLRAKINSSFLFQHLNLSTFIKDVLVRCTGTSYPAINVSNLSTLKISFPTPSEQQKIADFLSAIDKRLKLLKKKKTNLEDYKRGIMQRIFSQELRFTRPDGSAYPDWEEKKAKNIFKSHSNKQHNGQLPILAATQDRGVIPRADIDISIQSSDKSILSYKIVEVGDFVISLRSFQGGIEYSNYTGICSPAYTVLKTKVNINNTFYKQYFKDTEFIKRLANSAIGIRDGKQISYSSFSTIKLPYPTFEEQTQIADFLSAIDVKIEKLSEKIASTEEYKKGLLQMMFV